ncbi:toxin co-regulated pilus biosynthesis Q family protein [Telmatospirillum siberiense]|uniref:Toxin co-regulated pilus biosynthesis protein Q C-terminal domain-containing protein n=1 Tax=Telmatospirillum siberiense TaxID=382514 RepID=A0A2N3PQZ1_9PROT|nr:toxin co-regulated pilus biosynthesis Q family protein [Telmatospirillum siberiense]PKU22817.1 hypothetical protein CWS72_19365 [Telmatospirillum siberiense]
MVMRSRQVGGRIGNPPVVAWCIALMILAGISAIRPGHAAVGGAEDGARLVLGFEARSNRLTAADLSGLERLSVSLAAQPESRLVVFVPTPRDPAIRQFVRSRLNVVQQELAKRGMAGETVKSPRPEADDTIVLWVAPRVLPATPLEIEPIAATVAAPVPVSREETRPETHPTSLLPIDDGEKTARAGEAAAHSPSSPSAPTSSSPPLPAEGPVQGGGPPAVIPADSPPVVEAEVEELWIAPVGQSLRTVLKDWGSRSGWTVVWQSDREYPIDAAATFSGDFTKAASQLFEGFSTAVPVPSAHFYKGNRVLLVESGEGR